MPRREVVKEDGRREWWQLRRAARTGEALLISRVGLTGRRLRQRYK